MEKVGESWRRLEKVGTTTKKYEQVRESVNKCVPGSGVFRMVVFEGQRFQERLKNMKTLEKV